MNSPFFGEFAILLLILLNCARIFFLKFGKRDSLVLLAPISVILSVLQIFTWRADFFSILLIFISVFTFIINFRALLRFSSGLYIDHYSFAFKFGAIFVLIFCIFELILLFIFKPVFFKPNDFKISQEKIRLSGSFSSGFTKSGYFSTSDGIVTIYAPQKSQDYNNQTIIIIPDKRADSLGYIPYSYFLANLGYKVYIADFYASDGKWTHNLFDLRSVRRIYMIYNYLKNPVAFESQKEFYSYNCQKELQVIFDFVLQNESENSQNQDEQKPFIIGDWMSEIAIQDFCKIHKEKISGFVNLCNFNEYKNKGFGFVEQNNPFATYILKKYSKNFDTQNIDSIKELALKTDSLIPKKNKNSLQNESQNQTENSDENMTEKLNVVQNENSTENSTERPKTEIPKTESVLVEQNSVQ